MKFSGNEHKKIFTAEVSKNKKKRLSPSFISALFLLTSNKSLWRRVSRQVVADKINWNEIDIRGVSVQEYALLKLAKDFDKNTGKIAIMDLSDNQIFNKQTIKLILAALDIRR